MFPKKWSGGLFFAAPAIGVFVFLFVIPQLELVATSFGRPGPLTLSVYERFFGDAYYLRLLGRSLWLGAIVTLVTLLLGFPLAYWLARLESRWVPFLLLLVTFPLWVSALVRAFSWMVLFFRNGMLSRALQETGLVSSDFQLMFSFAGVVIALAQVLLPLMVITLYAVIRGIDEDLENAAMNLGASPGLTLWLVTMRLARGGIAAGALLVFSLSMSAFATPSLIGGARVPLISIAIYEQTLELLDWPFASAMSAVLLVVAVAVAFVSGRFGMQQAPRT
jgi:ABC-type spermidine/putrescine transport system permease subunit I